MGAFLAKKIGFLDIASVIEDTLASRESSERARPQNLEAILAADAKARATATQFCRQRAAFDLVPCGHSVIVAIHQLSRQAAKRTFYFVGRDSNVSFPLGRSPPAATTTTMKIAWLPPAEGIPVGRKSCAPIGIQIPPRLAQDGRRSRPSMPIDFHFLMIAWARDAFKQQRFLGWAMRTLEDNSILHASLLNQYGPEKDTFNDRECVDVILESLSIQDLYAIWDVTKPNIQLSAAYLVRMLSIDSSIEFAGSELAQTRVFGAGKVVEP